MKKELVIKIYILAGDFFDPKLWERFPNRVPDTRMVTGDEARRLIRSRSYLASRVFVPKEDDDGLIQELTIDTWSCFPMSYGETLVFDRRGWLESEKFSRLAEKMKKQILEMRAQALANGQQPDDSVIWKDEIVVIVA